MRRRQQRETSKLSKTLQVSEERVADAERVNSNLMELINKLRRGRADFLHSLAKLTERESAMSTDMKHFAQASTLPSRPTLHARHLLTVRDDLTHTTYTHLHTRRWRTRRLTRKRRRRRG